MLSVGFHFFLSCINLSCLVAEFYCPPLGRHWPAWSSTVGTASQSFDCIATHTFSVQVHCLLHTHSVSLLMMMRADLMRQSFRSWSKCRFVLMLKQQQQQWSPDEHWTRRCKTGKYKTELCRAIQTHSNCTDGLTPSAGQQQRRPQSAHYSDAAVHCRQLFVHSGVLLDGPLSCWKIVFLSSVIAVPRPSTVSYYYLLTEDAMHRKQF